MKTKSSYDAQQSNAKSGSQGDDAMTLMSGTGNTAVVHGLTADTFARSVPTHILPWYTRDAVMNAWHGLTGRRVDYTATTIPWYAYDGGLTAPDSVAKRLAVTVQDAEDWGRGDQTSAFGLYADLPMNPETVSRSSFWRFDPLAAELDPTMYFEPQLVALDAISQLFTESCAFHFGYLADIDSEYHRLRESGPLGRFDADSSEREPWFNLYHHWRDELERVYLAGPTPLVTLPQQLRDGNWTIGDVLVELMALMTTTNGELLPDLIVTAKGYQKGMSGITLGVKSDAAYLDSDGNTRFYHPYMQDVQTVSITQPTTTTTDSSNANLVSGGSAAQNYSGQTVRSAIEIGGIWEAFAAQTHPIGDANSWTSVLTAAGWSASMDEVYSDFMHIVSVPQSGDLTGYDGNTYQYWSGHTLNLYEMVKFLQDIGRALEPEVLSTLVYPMGVIASAEPFTMSPSGASARRLDELYNLYQSTYSFNENPARTYTGAHLGPTNHVIPAQGPGSLRLSGVPVHTNGLTARQRFWTPTIPDEDSLEAIAGAFFPNTYFDMSLYRRLDVEALVQLDNAELQELVARLLGNTTSMRTKVERPVYLPAGKSGPEATYASGLGQGAIELVMELIMAVHGASPRYGLGHGGYTDMRVAGGNPVVRGSEMVESGFFISPRSSHQDRDLISEAIGMPFGADDLEVPEAYTLSIAETPVRNSRTAELGTFDTVIPGLTVVDQDVHLASQFGFAPRGIAAYGDRPLDTVKWEESALPMDLQYGWFSYDVSGLSIQRQTINQAAIHNGGSGGGLAYAGYTIYQYPTSITVTHPQLAAPVVIPIQANPTFDVASGNTNDGLTDSTPWNGWVDALSGIRDSEGREYGVEHALYRPLNLDGTAYVDGRWAPFGSSSAVADAGRTRVRVPGMTMRELCAWAASVTHMTLNAADNSTELSWSDFEFEIPMTRRLVPERLYPGQTHVVYHDTNLGVTTNWQSMPLSGLPGVLGGMDMEMGYTLNVGGGDAGTSAASFSVTSVATQPTRGDHLEGLDLVANAGGGSIVNLGNGAQPPTGGGALPIAVGATLATFGAQVYGIDARSPRLSAATTWSVPSLDVSGNLESMRDTYWGLLMPVVASSWGHAGPQVPWFARIADNGAGAVTGSDFLTTNGTADVGTYTPLAPATGNVNSVAGRSVVYGHWPRARLIGTDTLQPGVGAMSEWASQLMYVYPDDPQHKMMYRPWRTIADASVHKELRMIFANNGEDASLLAGPLGIKMFGTPGQFRFAELLDADMAMTFVLELATSKTRLISPSHRSVLTFTKLALLDPATLRHSIPDVIDDVNQGLTRAGFTHKSSYSGSPVLTRELIRELQLGRQFQKL